MLPFPALTISAASSAYTTSSYQPILLPGINIIDAITNSTLILPISKMDTALIPYPNASIISSPPTPPTRSSIAVAATSIIISTLATKIKSIYYSPPNQTYYYKLQSYLLYHLTALL